MVDEQRRRAKVDSDMASGTDGGAFNQWLQVQLKARKLTQRQLAQKSGVDHSTISRLMRGGRVPSLRTATRLAQGLGVPRGLDRLDDRSLYQRGSPTASVEYALRSDDLLREADVREVMGVYLAARLRHSRRVATSAPMAKATRTSMPIVIEVAGMRPQSTTPGRRRRLSAGAPGARAVPTSRRSPVD